MKKLSLILAAALLFALLPVNVTALKTGDKLGNVLNTDIKVYINENQIPAYSINNNMVVVLSDLKNYGFDVTYNDTARTTTAVRNYKKAITPIQNIADNTKTVGTVAFDYVYTDIKVYIGNREINGYSINGKIVIFVNELEEYCNFTWNGTTRESKLQLLSEKEVAEKSLTWKAKPLSGKIEVGTTTPWEGAKADTTLYTNFSLKSVAEQYGETHGVKLKQMYEYTPNANNPYLPKSYTREGYTFPTKYPLYLEGKHNEMVIGDYVGVYLQGHLVHLGMTGTELVKIFGEPAYKTGKGLSDQSRWYFENGADFPEIQLIKSEAGTEWYIMAIEYYVDNTTTRKNLYGANTPAPKLKTEELYGVKIQQAGRTHEQLGAQMSPLKTKDIDNSGFGAPMAELIAPGMDVDPYRDADSTMPAGYHSPWWFRNVLNNGVVGGTTNRGWGLEPARYEPGTSSAGISFAIEVDGSFSINYISATK